MGFYFFEGRILNNYRMIIQYDGTNYAGWQTQKNAATIQQKITDAIELITKERVNLIGSGRTDAGVHALGQVANFRTERESDLFPKGCPKDSLRRILNRFHYSLNSILPNDISVLKIDKVDESFHARFDAMRRSYLYIFSHNKSPFYFKYAYYYPQITKIDLSHLNKISKTFLSEHDFTSFSKKNSEIENKMCSVSEIWWRKGKEFSTFYITANRFLHGMVRAVIGTLLYAAEKNLDENYLLEVLNKRDREEACESVPAKGLFLFKVRY